eukprot:FR735478.1.p3 GENE.FR735478.1~~FR735478.1.p3  ORF type:complete len:106 (-),score=64.61 FR735478.1:364-681(-)
MTIISPSAQLTLRKGNKSWSSPAVGAALELVDPLGFGPWVSLTAAAFFFFFFFFFFFIFFFFFFFFFFFSHAHTWPDYKHAHPRVQHGSVTGIFRSRDNNTAASL